MNLVARNISNSADIIEFGVGFTFESATDFIAERDTDFDNPWLPDYEFILVNASGEEFVFESAAWFEVA